MGMTWFEKRQARKRREAAEAAQLADAVERQAEKRLAVEVGAKLVRAGHATVEPSEAVLRERERVQALIKRDKDDHAREIMRAAAEIDLENGKTVSIVDAVIEPTPEWLEKGDVVRFTPRLENGTVKTVSGYRRQKTPIIERMFNAGKLSEDQYHACTWYNEQHAMAGLDGRVKSSNLSLSGNVGGGTGGMGQAPMALHEHEAQARLNYRAASAALTQFYLVFFEKIVLAPGIPISRAWRFSRAPKHKAEARFRAVAQELVDFCQSHRIETKGIGDVHSRD